MIYVDMKNDLLYGLLKTMNLLLIKKEDPL